MASNTDMQEFLQKHVDADLTYLLEDSGVPLKQQYDITQNYRTVKVFSAIADDRKEMRETCKADFQLDPATSAQIRVVIAQIITAWEASKEFVSTALVVK